MAKQYTEEELNLRRKLRRRLIGAAALTLAVVVILPMVLDSEPKSNGGDIELRIPAADKVGDFVPGKATEEVYDNPASAVSAASPDETISPVAVQATPSLPITVAAPASATVVATEKSSPVVAQAAPAPIKKIEPAKTVASSAKNTVVAKPAPTKATATEDSFVAQVGAYSSADTAKRELAQLKAWGFKAYTEKSGNTIRVRVGPYPEREKAEKVRVLLEKHGLHPVVTSAK
ncbi:MAG: SPOR domain-containing protein [Gallionella sp.]|nr:SPOR domain-containing protein [Gallionella sp.]